MCVCVCVCVCVCACVRARARARVCVFLLFVRSFVLSPASFCQQTHDFDPDKFKAANTKVPSFSDTSHTMCAMLLSLVMRLFNYCYVRMSSLINISLILFHTMFRLHFILYISE